MSMEHRCFEHAEFNEESFELVDGHIRGKVRARCQKCGAELSYEYVLDKMVEPETGKTEYISC